jgi:hypothetical protein
MGWRRAITISILARNRVKIFEASVPHVAFEVDDLAAALEGKEILTPPNSPSEGVTSAMILDNGAPVELIAFQFAQESTPR